MDVIVSIHNYYPVTLCFYFAVWILWRSLSILCLLASWNLTSSLSLFQNQTMHQ